MLVYTQLHCPSLSFHQSMHSMEGTAQACRSSTPDHDYLTLVLSWVSTRPLTFKVPTFSDSDISKHNSASTSPKLLLSVNGCVSLRFGLLAILCVLAAQYEVFWDNTAAFIPKSKAPVAVRPWKCTPFLCCDCLWKGAEHCCYKCFGNSRSSLPVIEFN